MQTLLRCAASWVQRVLCRACTFSISRTSLLTPLLLLAVQVQSLMNAFPKNGDKGVTHCYAVPAPAPVLPVSHSVPTTRPKPFLAKTPSGAHPGSPRFADQSLPPRRRRASHDRQRVSACPLPFSPAAVGCNAVCCGPSLQVRWGMRLDWGGRALPAARYPTGESHLRLPVQDQDRAQALLWTRDPDQPR